MTINQSVSLATSPWGVTCAQRAAMKPSAPVPRARKPNVIPTSRVCNICHQEQPGATNRRLYADTSDHLELAMSGL